MLLTRPTLDASPRPGLLRRVLPATLLLAISLGCNRQPSADATHPSLSEEPSAEASIPFIRQHIYSETADPKAEIAAAIKQATAQNKRIILDFGGDWCGDCHVLDLYLHAPPNGPILAQHYVLVHIFIGHMDANMNIPAEYGVPVTKGVPALALLDSHGKLLYAQQNKEFEKGLTLDKVTAYLNQWKA